jgi:hypothetical protein
MTSESTISKEFPEAFRVGFLMAGNTDVERLAEFGPRSFLLGPGGQDYVGDNGYDNKKGSEERAERLMSKAEIIHVDCG